MSEKGCDTCANRGPWQWQQPYKNRYLMARCSIPAPGWPDGVCWVMANCGSECRSYVQWQAPSFSAEAGTARSTTQD